MRPRGQYAISATDGSLRGQIWLGVAPALRPGQATRLYLRDVEAGAIRVFEDRA